MLATSNQKRSGLTPAPLRFRGGYCCRHCMRSNARRTFPSGCDKLRRRLPAQSAPTVSQTVEGLGLSTPRHQHRLSESIASICTTAGSRCTGPVSSSANDCDRCRGGPKAERTHHRGRGAPTYSMSVRPGRPAWDPRALAQCDLFLWHRISEPLIGRLRVGEGVSAP